MRLRELDGHFLKNLPPTATQPYKAMQQVETLSEADGVMFQCPLCAVGLERGSEDGRQFVRGAHYVICWFVGKVPDDLDPKPGRWHPQGTSLDDLTFVGPGACSVLITTGCKWHGFVRNGDAS